ncbi:ABC transporter ATP-binding protein [Thermodesulfobacteriota bacterium]
MLKVNNIEVVFKNVILVLKGISLEVPEGEIIALLGSNGAGKTTTLKSISGLLKSQDGKISDGSIDFFSEKIDGLDPEIIVQKGITVVPEGRMIFPKLTVHENLLVGGYRSSSKAERLSEYDNVMTYFPLLDTRKKVWGGYLSGGEQQMLAIGRALISGPKLLMLDECSLGLAPMIVEEIFKILRSINSDKGIALLMVEQNAMVALSNCSYGYIMENGKIVMDGPSEKLIKNQDIQEFYLGLTAEAAKKSYADVKHYKRRKRWLS